MGRKQNPTIEEHFTRGEKNDDTSNRYEQTCKHCGEHFPKGRIEGLSNHLIKKCPGLSLKQKTQIVLRIHDLGDLDNTQQEDAQDAANASSEPSSSAEKQNFEGLNALAEASRRVGGATQHGIVATNGTSATGQDVVVDPRLQVGISDLSGLSAGVDGGSGDGQSGIHNFVPPLPALYPFVSPDGAAAQDTSPDFPNLELSTDPGATLQDGDLSTIAASANATLDDNLLTHGPSASATTDHTALAMFENLAAYTRSNANSHLQALATTTWSGMSNNDMGSLPENLRSSNHPAASASSVNAVQHSELPVLSAPSKKTSDEPVRTEHANRTQKPRSRFSDARRVQVKEIRKQGSCLRCRMLKKTCSEETPCRQCLRPDRARLWKQPCIRKRLNECFDLFQRNMFNLNAHREIEALRTRIPLVAMPGKINAIASLCPASTISFRTSQGQLPGSFQGLNPSQDAVQVFVIYEAEDVKTKVLEYLKASIEQIVEREQSHVVRAALESAMDLAEKHPGNLLPGALELWTAVTILADENTTWKFLVDHSTDEPQSQTHHQEPEISIPSIRSQATITPVESHEAQHLLAAQMRGALDKMIADKGDFVMRELERRLVMRQQTTRFEVYLGALILLNCAERMSWLFPAVQLVDGPESSPRDAIGRGKELAELLETLVVMRGMHLDTIVDETSNTIQCGEGVDELGAAWLASLNITPAWLDEREQAEYDNRSHTSFDGKLFSRLIRPRS